MTRLSVKSGSISSHRDDKPSLTGASGATCLCASGPALDHLKSFVRKRGAGDASWRGKEGVQTIAFPMCHGMGLRSHSDVIRRLCGEEDTMPLVAITRHEDIGRA